MIKVEELYWQVMSLNSQKLHEIMDIPLTKRIPIMDSLKAQTSLLANQEDEFMQLMRGFREASAQGLSPDPMQLMEQVNLIYPNLI